jgi:hypothetical protein
MFVSHRLNDDAHWTLLSKLTCTASSCSCKYIKLTSLHFSLNFWTNTHDVLAFPLLHFRGLVINKKIQWSCTNKNQKVDSSTFRCIASIPSSPSWSIRITAVMFAGSYSQLFTPLELGSKSNILVHFYICHASIIYYPSTNTIYTPLDKKSAPLTRYVQK